MNAELNPDETAARAVEFLVHLHPQVIKLADEVGLPVGVPLVRAVLSYFALRVEGALGRKGAADLLVDVACDLMAGELDDKVRH